MITRISKILIILILSIVYLAGLGLINFTSNNFASAKNNLDLNTVQNSVQINKSFVGLNGYGALVLKDGNDPRFIENLKQINPKNYRFHDFIQKDSAENWRAFADNKNKTWDRAKIKQWADMIRVWRKNGINPDITVTVASFPDWMKRQTFNGQKLDILDESEYQNYSKFVSELVKIINVEEKLDIKNIEITNELDVVYGIKLEQMGFENKIHDLANVYVQVARSIRNVDKNIKIGGPSFARADKANYIESFLSRIDKLESKNLLNFISYHSYASGNYNDSDKDIFAKATGNVEYFNSLVKKSLEKYNYNDTKIYLNEYNISWTSSNNDNRMRGFKGAIYDGLVLSSSLKQGIWEVSSWTDKDEVYGKMGNDFKLRPSSKIHQLFANNLSSGSVIKVKNLNINSNSNQNIESLLVKDEEKYKLLIINLSKINESITIIKPNNKALSKYISLIEGQNDFQETNYSENLVLKPESINYFEFSPLQTAITPASSSKSSESAVSIVSSSSSAVSSENISSSSRSSQTSSSVNSSQISAELVSSASSSSSSSSDPSASSLQASSVNNSETNSSLVSSARSENSSTNSSENISQTSSSQSISSSNSSVLTQILDINQSELESELVSNQSSSVSSSSSSKSQNVLVLINNPTQIYKPDPINSEGKPILSRTGQIQFYYSFCYLFLFFAINKKWLKNSSKDKLKINLE